MKDKHKTIAKLKLSSKIPYYNNKFQILINIMNDQIDKFNKNNIYDMSKYVELMTIIEGIKYYHKVAVTEVEWDEQRRRSICNKLIKSTNRSIFSLLSEEKNPNKNTKKCMLAYKEYLQVVANLFRIYQEENGQEAPKLIFSFNVDLMSEIIKVDQPFSSIYASKVKKADKSLCTVFSCLNTNMDIDNIFTYLPMLTHEVSHNFRYSKRKDRNEFVVKYMLEEIADAIVVQLFAQVSGDRYVVFLGKEKNVFIDIIKSVFEEEIRLFDSEYMENGQLDVLPSIILSIIKDSINEEENIEIFYKKGTSEFNVLKSSFIGLLQLSNIDWYFSSNVENFSANEDLIKVHLMMDFLSGEEFEAIIKKYNKYAFTEKKTSVDLDDLFYKNTQNETCISINIIKSAAEELIISVMEKIKMDFNDFAMNEKFSESLDNLIISLIENGERFEDNLEVVIDLISETNEQIIYDLVDRCIMAKSYIDNIFYICKVNNQRIVRLEKNYRIIKKIYEQMHDAIEMKLKDDKERTYFVSRNIHAACIKLGLLNDRNNPEIFQNYYLQIFNEWDNHGLSDMIDEYLCLYREVFADLTMCAVFKFDQYGYYKYVRDQFGEIEDGFSRSMTMERVHTVMRIMEKEHDKEMIRSKFSVSTESNAIDFWHELIKSYFSDNRKQKYDQYYEDVYYKKILPSKWIEILQNEKIIRQIGQYYNDNIIPEDGVEKVCKAFIEEYIEHNELRKKKFEESGLDAFKVTLGEEGYENT